MVQEKGARTDRILQVVGAILLGVSGILADHFLQIGRPAMVSFALVFCITAFSRQHWRKIRHWGVVLIGAALLIALNFACAGFLSQVDILTIFVIAMAEIILLAIVVSIVVERTSWSTKESGVR